MLQIMIKQKPQRFQTFNLFLETKQLEKTVTSAEILSCNTNPVTIIPGIAGHFIVPISIWFRFNFVTTPYTASNRFFIDLGQIFPLRWCVAPGLNGQVTTQNLLMDRRIGNYTR